MKKNILIGLAALLLCGTVNATSWRVCSKPEAGANFLSVADAVASNNVFAGDTLYVEPGHHEQGSQTLNINKSLTVIGPGYHLTENNINTICDDEVIFNRTIYLSAEGTSIYGCWFVSELHVNSNNHTISSCKFTNDLTIHSVSNVNVCNNFIFNAAITGYEYTPTACVIENNIVYGYVANRGILANFYANGKWSNCIFRNNTVIANSNEYIFFNMQECEIYNNIIINTNSGFTTQTNSNQTIDTTYYREFALSSPEDYSNNVYNNILSCKSNPLFRNCVFNANVEDVLIWNEANTLEEKYKHKANGPAVGAGVNGTTCGAYGAVNGSRAYQPAGIPQYRPYIYDANIDETPSSNNTINASFKIKVQQ